MVVCGHVAAHVERPLLLEAVHCRTGRIFSEGLKLVRAWSNAIWGQLVSEAVSAAWLATCRPLVSADCAVLEGAQAIDSSVRLDTTLSSEPVVFVRRFLSSEFYFLIPLVTPPDG